MRRPIEPKIPRVARIRAFAHRVQAGIDDGTYAGLAEAAETHGMTRARMTQIINLLLLEPSIQEAVLRLEPVTSGRDRITEKMMRPIVAEIDWRRQHRLWARARCV